MKGDPSHRPSNERVRVIGHVDALVWVECASCLGDGWHYPQIGVMLDRLPPTRKLTCMTCAGTGARQVAAITLSPGARIVSAPTERVRQSTAR